MGTSAFAGHAGDMTTMPQEFLAALAILTIIGLILTLIGLIGLALLFRIDRRLRKLQ